MGHEWKGASAVFGGLFIGSIVVLWNFRGIVEVVENEPVYLASLLKHYVVHTDVAMQYVGLETQVVYTCKLLVQACTLRNCALTVHHLNDHDWDEVATLDE